VQEEVLRAWYDWALLGRTLALVEEDAALLGLGADEVAGRVRSGAAGSSEQLRAQDLLDRTRSELERRRSEVAPLQARLNALLGRAPDEKLSFPDELPPPRVLPVSDLELLQLGAQRSAELAAFERQIAGREEALSLARQAVFPDFGISWNMMGTVSRTIGGMLVLPTRFEAIKAGIEEARALLKAAQAARAQYERDLKASFVVQLAVLRNAERQAAWFEETILPRARDQAALSRSVYAAGRGGFADVVEARRAVLGAEQTVAELRMERERALAALETWAAVDVEAMAPPAAAQPVGRAMR
jgi:cobalt-zinc-cadmium efflux system outer membrane protein